MFHYIILLPTSLIKLYKDADELQLNIKFSIFRDQNDKFESSSDDLLEVTTVGKRSNNQNETELGETEVRNKREETATSSAARDGCNNDEQTVERICNWVNTMLIQDVQDGIANANFEDQ